jgi:hypothetical protein
MRVELSNTRSDSIPSQTQRKYKSERDSYEMAKLSETAVESLTACLALSMLEEPTDTGEWYFTGRTFKLVGVWGTSGVVFRLIASMGK